MKRTVHIAWWARAYLLAVAAKARLLGREPDVEAAWERVKAGVVVECHWD